MNSFQGKKNDDLRLLLLLRNVRTFWCSTDHATFRISFTCTKTKAPHTYMKSNGAVCG